MKTFPSTIQAILTTLACTLLLSGCGHVWSTRESFVSDEKPMPVINDATVFPKLVPLGGNVGLGLNTMIYFAGVETATGPYAIYVVAHGKPGTHETLTVRELKLRSSRGKTESIPYSMLGNPVPFKRTTDPSVVQATYGCDIAWNPGNWEEVGPIDVEIEATVTAKGKSRTRSFTISLVPETRKEREFETIGGELLRSLQRKQRLIESP